MTAMSGFSILEGITIEGVGAFTPPPSPCGNDECGWVELDLIHRCGLPDVIFEETK